jgi:hypothetical protein
MTTTRNLRPTLALGLGLIIVIGSARSSPAQRVSSGSGAGTGTGQEAGGLGATGTGAESGGLGATSGRPFQRPAGGPGMGGQFPSGPRPEPMERPRVVNPGEVERLFGKDEPPLVAEALKITDPGERALALVRIARTSIFLGRPDLGHIAVFQAAKDCVQANDATARDQAIVSTVQAALALAEEHMRDVVSVDANRDIVPDLPKPINTDRASNLERGRQEWDLAFRLAFEIRNRSSRTETLFRVAESESLGSSSLVREPARLLGTRPDAGKLPATTRGFSDRLLKTAIEHAAQIERPVWRDRAMVAIATNASVSGQFDRAEEAALAIPQPEVRTDALLRIAENQVVFGRPDYATQTYAQAAKTIAEVPVADPRETLVGVLIDSLIAYGRFDDARASTVLYANPSNPPIALSAIAESQGRRGLSASAQKWIEAEQDSGLRSLLYRKLNDGVLYSVEQKRAAELSGGSGLGR